jgi:predicted ATPase/transcriptional regulator with XRE-family HTH domain
VLDCGVPASGGEQGAAGISAAAAEVATFGARLRRLRRRAGLSREQLAERAGVSVPTIQALELGQRRQPHPHTLRALADALGLAPEDREALLAPAAAAAAEPRPPPAITGLRLSVPPTPLVGRAAEVAQVRAVLDPGGSQVRLLVLVGPGGVGKTRLALAAAAELASCYPDGVAFVDLAPLRDARLVAATIARALEVRESGGRSARELVLEHLRARQLLLVLDNFEHLPAAAPLLAELLGACPRLALLVTSRAALRLRGEQRFAVPPLATPPLPAAGTTRPEGAATDALTAAPAVQLFVARALAVAADFVLSERNAAAVAGICRRLDGIPLAIELAAARVTLLSPEALLHRLERRVGPHATEAPALHPGRAGALPLLTAGPADVPERQQTLRATLSWSYDLLEPGEQVLFRRLAVFAGGWTPDAAEAVCADAALSADEVLDRLQVLVDSSLVYRREDTGGEPRFGLLETIREFAQERLDASGEVADIRQRHHAWYLALTEAEPLEQISPPHVSALARDNDNLRAALAWALRAGHAEACFRLAIGMAPLWYLRGRYAEGRAWVADALALEAGAPPARLRSQALSLDGLLASCQGDFGAAEARLADGLAMALAIGDEPAALLAWHLLGTTALRRGDLAQAAERHAQALAIARRLDLTTWQGVALTNLAAVARQQRRYARARSLGLEAAALLRRTNHAWGLARALQILAAVARADHDQAAADRLLDEALTFARDLGDQQGLAQLLLTLGHVARARRAPVQAAAAYAEGLATAQAAGDPVYLARHLEGLATLLAEPCPGEAVRLAAAAATARRRMGIASVSDDREPLQEALRGARARLGPALSSANWAAGQAWPLEHAVAQARHLVEGLQATTS